MSIRRNRSQATSSGSVVDVYTGLRNQALTVPPGTVPASTGDDVWLVLADMAPQAMHLFWQWLMEP